MNALTSEEAEVFFEQAVQVLETLDDDSSPTNRAVPRAVMTRGEAMAMLGALVALIAEGYPHVSASPDVLDLAASYYREIH